MSNLGLIIGWKFNHQSGMVTKNNVITQFPSGVDGVDYVDGLPSDANVTTWTNEYNAHLTATAYIAKRVAEYPTTGEQFDKIYHDGIDEWKKVIKAVKDKYPKE